MGRIVRINPSRRGGIDEMCQKRLDFKRTTYTSVTLTKVFWNFGIGVVALGTFTCDLSLGTICLGLFAGDLLHGILIYWLGLFTSEVLMRIFLLGTVAWELRLWSFGSGAFNPR